MNYRQAFSSSEYVSSSDLQGREIRVRITHVGFEEVQSPEEGAKQKLVANLQGKKKRLVLNKTNAETLAALTGSDETDRWINLEVVLYPVRTTFKGKEVDGVRLRGITAPTSAPAIIASVAPSDFAGDVLEDDIPF